MTPELETSPAGQIAPQKSFARAPRFGAVVWLGLSLCTAGAAMALIPTVWPAAAWIHVLCLKHGATPATLFLSGLACSAIGLGLRRLVRWHAGELETLANRPDPLAPALSKLGSELAQVRGSLDDLRIEHVYVKDGVKRLDTQMQDQLATANPQGLQEAMFRMAGSLDQVGARLDERLSTQNDTFQQTLRTFHDSLLTAFVRLDELHGRITPPAEGEDGSIPAIRGLPALGVLDQIEDPTASMPMPLAPLPHQNPADVALAHKIAQLTRLMADADVQQVLHGMPPAPAVMQR